MRSKLSPVQMFLGWMGKVLIDTESTIKIRSTVGERNNE